MVLSTTQSNSPAPFVNNKENVIVKPLRNNNGRRQRTHPNASPSPAALAREATRDPGRRRTQSPHSRTPTRSIRVTVEGMDVDMAEMSTPAASNGSQRTIQLPRQLKRPTFREISPVALEAVDSELKGVALEYIHHSLQITGQQMLAVATSTTTVSPRDRLPRELEVIIHDHSASAPTHLLAIYSKTASRVSIHPAHALIFAAHCAHLPPFPTPKFESSTNTLPVVPLCLPNPPSFPILMHYLYTKRTDHLFASLLPMAPGSGIQCLSQLSQNFAATFTVQALLAHISRVHGLWSNVVALGIFDEKLWRSIEMVWEVLVESLAVSTGSQWQSEKIQL